MTKTLSSLILAYLFLLINNSAFSQSEDGFNPEDNKILKIGVLLPLSGEFKDIGESFLKSIQLALYDISNENILKTIGSLKKV